MLSRQPTYACCAVWTPSRQGLDRLSSAIARETQYTAFGGIYYRAKAASDNISVIWPQGGIWKYANTSLVILLAKLGGCVQGSIRGSSGLMISMYFDHAWISWLRAVPRVEGFLEEVRSASSTLFRVPRYWRRSSTEPGIKVCVTSILAWSAWLQGPPRAA